MKRIGKAALVVAVFLAVLGLAASPSASAEQNKPNILVSWGDGIGIQYINAYNLGVMGYTTPNIDRLAKEGALFTDAYAQQSCTAGRASFILGQHPFRTGLLTVGFPGSAHGIPDWTPTIADLLKQQGYTTAQFGKNHLGDNKFLGKAVSDKKPFFIWFNTTRMHVRTRLKKSSDGVTGIGLYPDGMVEHDAMVGQLLKQLDDLGIADNTIVIYGADNGAETASWPDGGITPFHGEKGTTWEGGFRVPMIVRWPGVIKPGTLCNQIFSQEDWMPTLLAAAGVPDVKEKLMQGYQANGRTFKVHLDGYNFLPYFKGETAKGPREEILYFGQSGEFNAIRWNDWKANFAGVQGNIMTGTRNVTSWPLLVNLRADPYERMPFESQMYLRCYADNMWRFIPIGQKVKEFLVTIPQYPFQEGAAMQPANINYMTLKAVEALKRLHEMEQLANPNN